MAVGKQSLGRVAKSNVIGAVSPEVAEMISPAVNADATTDKTKTATVKKAKQAPASANRIFAVGDKLPEYLL